MKAYIIDKNSLMEYCFYRIVFFSNRFYLTTHNNELTSMFIKIEEVDRIVIHKTNGTLIKFQKKDIINNKNIFIETLIESKYVNIYLNSDLNIEI